MSKVITNREFSSRKLIDEFLGFKRIAFVGLSSKSKDFSRSVFKEFLKRGYDVIPVNPKMNDIDGMTVYSKIQDIDPPVQGAFLMTPPEKTNEVVKDCFLSNITSIWMHRGVGKGSVSEEALQYCNENGINVVSGHCPLMFFPNANIGHKIHGFFKKLTGSYPK
jgi:predicted CoA-binding protein